MYIKYLCIYISIIYIYTHTYNYTYMTMYINPINSILDLSGHPPVGLDWGSQLCIRSRSSWTSGFWGEVFGKRQGWKTMGNYRANWENVGKTGKYRKIWKHIGTSGKLWETSLIEIGSEVKPPPKSIVCHWDHPPKYGWTKWAKAPTYDFPWNEKSLPQ